MDNDRVQLVLNELRKTLDLTVGINTFYKATRGLHPGWRILIRAVAVTRLVGLVEKRIEEV